VASHDPGLESLLNRLRHGPHGACLLLTVLEPRGIRYGISTPPQIIAKSESAVPFIRATDIKDGEIQRGGLLYIDRDQPPRMQKALLKDGELIIVRSGVNTGDCAPVPADLVGAYAAYDLILTFRGGRRSVLPDFIAVFLDTETGRRQLNVLKGRSAQPHLNAEEVRSLLVPCPSSEAQLRLLSGLKAARDTWREKLTQSQALFAGLDSFVLNSLGLTVPADDAPTIYAVRLRDTRQRFDPDYNSPHFRTLRAKIQQGSFPADSVGSLFYPMISGFAAGADDQTDDPTSGVPHIRPLNITNIADLTFEGTKMVPRVAVAPGDFLKKGEVLFNNTNSTAWVGKTVVFDADRDCACSNHITRLALIDEDHNPYYFAALFNALRSLGFFGLLSTNFNNQAGINVETLKSVRIPVPDPKTQEHIASEVARRRVEARRLREDASKIWNDARRGFEKELLGPEPTVGELRADGVEGQPKK
jgi:type I restriction enzyme S subunit